MELQLKDLPVIDWELGEKLAGNKRVFAKELLELLVSTLTADFLTIKNFYETKNYPQLLQRVHKLHGAVCYCGVPRLKSVLSHLEINLKTNRMESLPSLFYQLEAEVSLLLETYSSQLK